MTFTWSPWWYLPTGAPALEPDGEFDCATHFCGAGGDAAGAVLAGVKPVMAINHWALAIDSHAANHPWCEHDVNDLLEVPPSRYAPTWGAWFSPECTTWSQARGRQRNFSLRTPALPGIGDDGPPPTEAEIRSRATMETVVHFSAYHRYRVVVVENVVDILAWGELGRWYAEMEAFGYRHKTLFLNSMFFGVPQSRDRFYAVFWQAHGPTPDLDFRPPAWCPKCAAIVGAIQSWKNPKRPYGRYREQYVYRCPRCTTVALPLVMPALAAINLGLPIQRIGDREKPLAVATMRRIAYGAWKYWGCAVVLDTLRHPKYRDIATMPLPTQTSRQSQALYVPLPLVTRFRGTSAGHLGSSAGPVSDPLGTISAGGNHHALVDPLVIKNFGDAAAAGPMSLPASTRPLGAITGRDHHSLLEAPAPFIAQAAGNTFDRPESGYFRVREPEREPLWTQPGTASTALVTSYYSRDDAARSPGEPLATVTVEPRHLVVPINGGRQGDGGHKVRTTADPLLTQTGDLARALVVPDVEAYVSAHYARSVASRHATDGISTQRGQDGHGLSPIRLEDCGFRMLEPQQELKPGMGFSRAYVVLGSKRDATQQIGQAVTPPVSTAIWGRLVEAYR